MADKKTEAKEFSDLLPEDTDLTMFTIWGYLKGALKGVNGDIEGAKGQIEEGEGDIVEGGEPDQFGPFDIS